MSASTSSPSSANPPVGPPFWMKLLGGPLGGGVDLGLLILRVVFAGFLAFGHGLGKFQQIGNPPTEFPDPLGIGVTNSFYGAATSEFVFSLLVLVGLFTRLSTLPVIFAMGVAAFVIHAKDPLFMAGGPAKEPALLFLGAFLPILFAGPGKFSIDGLMMLPRKEQ
jgi:putative oxidoreductase